MAWGHSDLEPAVLKQKQSPGEHSPTPPGEFLVILIRGLMINSLQLPGNRLHLAPPAPVLRLL